MSQGQPGGYGPPGYPTPGYAQQPGYPPQGYAQQPPGPPPPKPAKWYHNTFIVAFFMLFFFPVGLVLLWTSPKASMGAKIGGSVVIGIIFLMAISGSNKEHAGATADRITPGGAQAVSAPAERVSYVTESCLKLATMFGTQSKLSDLQKEELWKQYDGKAFQWDLEIVEVSSGMLSGFTVQAKCAPQSPSLIQDIQISYGGNAKSVVMQLVKGNVYKLKGTLTNSSSLLGMAADALP